MKQVESSPPPPPPKRPREEGPSKPSGEGEIHEIPRDKEVYDCNTPLTELSKKALRIRYNEGLSCLVSTKDVEEVGALPFNQQLAEFKAVQAEAIIRSQVLLAEVDRAAEVEAERDRAKAKVNELNVNLKKANTRIKELQGRLKKSEGLLEKAMDQNKTLLEVVKVQCRQLCRQRRIAMQWLETEEGEQFLAKVGVKSLQRGQDLMVEMYRIAVAEKIPGIDFDFITRLAMSHERQAFESLASQFDEEDLREEEAERKRKGRGGLPFGRGIGQGCPARS